MASQIPNLSSLLNNVARSTAIPQANTDDMKMIFSTFGSFDAKKMGEAAAASTAPNWLELGKNPAVAFGALFQEMERLGTPKGACASVCAKFLPVIVPMIAATCGATTPKNDAQVSMVLSRAKLVIDITDQELIHVRSMISALGFRYEKTSVQRQGELTDIYFTPYKIVAVALFINGLHLPGFRTKTAKYVTGRLTVDFKFPWIAELTKPRDGKPYNMSDEDVLLFSYGQLLMLSETKKVGNVSEAKVRKERTAERELVLKTWAEKDYADEGKRREFLISRARLMVQRNV